MGAHGMTRGRVVSADKSIGAKIEQVLNQLLTKPRDQAKTRADIAEMRGTIEQEKPAKGVFDFKLMPGGLIDLEFIAQGAVLSGSFIGKRMTSTQAILAGLADTRLSISQRELLLQAHQIFSSMTQILRLCLNSDPQSEELEKALIDIMCKAADMPDGKSLLAHLRNTAAQVRSVFDLLFREPPAAA